uniref:Striatin N-terminal domain-containing protein n=1 Tax=Pseudonaja textilis TaxID=8673 RepID=A0A670ZMC0_PSETE
VFVQLVRMAQVAFLQGERKGQENLKADLVRRIKMLEYALKQERSKYHKLKFGTELNQGEKKPEASEPGSFLEQGSEGLAVFRRSSCSILSLR